MGLVTQCRTTRSANEQPAASWLEWHIWLPLPKRCLANVFVFRYFAESCLTATGQAQRLHWPAALRRLSWPKRVGRGLNLVRHASVRAGASPSAPDPAERTRDLPVFGCAASGRAVAECPSVLRPTEPSRAPGSRLRTEEMFAACLHMATVFVSAGW